MSGLVKMAIQFLRWYCAEDRIDEVEGDITELHEYRKSSNPKLADLSLVWDVLRSIRWVNIKKVKLTGTRWPLMINYFTIGYRNIIKDYRFSMINLFGLSMGLSVFITMMLMMRHEMSFDHFHEERDRIFHVIQDFKTLDGVEPEIFTALPLAKALVEDMSMVTNAVTVHSAASTWVSVEGRRFFEEEGIVAGPSFFDLFDFPVVYGQQDRLLTSDYSIVISRDMAEKFFGTENPIGEVIDIERYGLFTVTGVIEVPANSFIQFDFILTQNYETFFEFVHPRFPAWFQSWRGDPAATFVMLDNPAGESQFEERVREVLSKYMTEEEVNPHRLVNLKELHFGLAQVDGQINHYLRGDRGQLQLLILVASLILFMACFNFINLLTARSINRSREVGIRKSIGATRSQVFNQFMTESSIQVMLAMVLSIGWILLVLPYFERLTGIRLDLEGELFFSFLPYLALLFVMLTFLSGLYPALVISRFEPRKALLTVHGGKSGKWSLRAFLLTVQYTIVIIMIAGLLIVERQFQFMTNKPLGFDASQLLIVEVNGAGVRNNFELLKQDLLTNPNVSDVSGLTRMIAGYRSGVDVAITDPEDLERKQLAQFYGMDGDGIDALGLTLVSGELPVGSRYLDSTSVYLNQTAASWFDIEPVQGQWIEISGNEGEDVLRAKVAGIIKDFHYSSLHESIGPLVIGDLSNPFQSLDDIVIRVNSQDLSETLAYVEEVHNRYDENDVMTWEFLDDMVERAYQRELIIRDVFLGASITAFVIAIIGLVSLLSLSSIEKTKELAIRKILGADYLALIGIQAKSFILYASIAALIGIPIVGLLRDNWLEGFAYRLDFSLLPFTLSIITVLLSTIMIVWTINHGVIRSNPVQSLRNE